MKTRHIIIPFVSAALFVSCNKAEDTSEEAAPAAAEQEAATVETPAQEVPVEEVAGVQSLQQKLKTIIIPKVDFVDMSVKECLEILRLRAIEFDPETDENRKGVNFMIRTQPDAADIGGLKVDELRLTNVPLGTTLQYICDKARLGYKVNDHAVIILPLPEDGAVDLYARTFVVLPDFISRLSQHAGSDDNHAIGELPKVKKLLEDIGVSFPDKASVTYTASNNKLVVYNTLGNLDIIAQILKKLEAMPPIPVSQQ